MPGARAILLLSGGRDNPPGGESQDGAVNAYRAHYRKLRRLLMTDLEAQEIMVADALAYAARYRRESLTLKTYKTPRRSKDNVGAHDGHKANTYRRQPRTAYSNPSLAEGTSPSMVVTLPTTIKDDKGQTKTIMVEHVVPATRNWRSHVKTIEHKDTTVDTAKVQSSQADYD